MTHNPTTVHRMFLGLVFWFSWLGSFFQINSFDIFWHIMAGNHMIGSSSIISTNVFSWTHPEYPWVPTYWLFEVLVSFIYGFAGFSGLVVFKCLIIALTLTLMTAYVLKTFPDFPKVILSLLLVTLFESSYFRFILRPHIFTFLGIASLLVSREWSEKRRFVFHSLVFLFWSNLHSGVIFGVLWQFFYELSRLKGKNPWSFAVSMTPALCCLINPTAWEFLLYLVDHLHMKRVLNLSEFEKIRPDVHAKYLLMLMFQAACPLGILLFRRQLNLFHGLTTLLCIFLLNRGIRFLPDAMFLLWPMTIEGLQPLFQGTRLRILHHTGCAFILPVIYAFWLICFQFPASDGNYRFGSGISPTLYPTELLDRFGHEIQSGRLYNSFSTGGYILFHSKGSLRVFQDGRIHAYPADFHTRLDQAKSDATQLRDWFDSWKIDYALFDTTEDPVILSDWLLTDGWRLLYDNGRFRLLQRHISS